MDAAELQELELAAAAAGVDAAALKAMPGVEDLVFYVDGSDVRVRSLMSDDDAVPLRDYMKQHQREKPASSPATSGTDQEHTMDLLEAVKFVKAAEAAGLNPVVLAKMPGADKLKVVERDGVVYATPEGGKEQLLTEYAEATWPEFMLALEGESEGPAPKAPAGKAGVIDIDRVAAEQRATGMYAL